jgi:hypothetical protein
MTWYVIPVAVILLILLYRAISSGPRKAAKSVGEALNIKPNFVEDMIIKMGSERGQMFVSHINNWQEESINDAVYTFYAYQIFMKNPHPENIKWWHDRLVEQGYNPHLDSSKVATISVYLKDAGLDMRDLEKLSIEHNATYCK